MPELISFSLPGGDVVRSAAVVAKTGVEGHLEVKLTWTRDLPPAREEEVEVSAG